MVVFRFAEGRVAVRGVVRTVPVVGPGGAGAEEDLVAALRAADVVAEAEVLVQEEGALGDPLEAVLALNVIWVMFDII